VAIGAEPFVAEPITKTLGVTRCSLYMQDCGGLVGTNLAMNHLEGVDRLFYTAHVLAKAQIRTRTWTKGCELHASLTRLPAGSGLSDDKWTRAGFQQSE